MDRRSGGEKRTLELRLEEIPAAPVFLLQAHCCVELFASLFMCVVVSEGD